MTGRPAGWRGRIQVVRRADATAAAEAAAEHLARRVRAAVDARGRAWLAVSGGRSPWTMLAALAGHDLPWAATRVAQVDERIGPAADDPRRNLAGLRDALPDDCAARVVPMPVDGDDLAAACADYARALPDVLDLVHLGLGADGHTASLVPDDPVLTVHDVDVALTRPYQGLRRMTLTYPRIARSREIVWLVTGEEKAPALDRLLAGDPAIPAGRVEHPHQVLFTDLP